MKTINKTSKIPTQADLAAILPTVNALARTVTFGFPEVEVGTTYVCVDLKLPELKKLRVLAAVDDGRWVVKTSLPHMQTTDREDTQHIINALTTAKAIAAVLEALGR